MSNNQKKDAELLGQQLQPDGWATLSPEGEYVGNDDEIHLDRAETVICAEDWADGYRVAPVNLIDPQELAKLRAVRTQISLELKSLKERVSKGKGTWPSHDYITDERWAIFQGQISVLERLNAITAPKEEG